ncbi:MAG TPA: beta-1,3-glucanase family protein [Chthoniobacteraceae bacterium]|nr:beta-1,3-glucanase family protein [Chthoniobacteraceae bacterium]
MRRPFPLPAGAFLADLCRYSVGALALALLLSSRPAVCAEPPLPPTNYQLSLQAIPIVFTNATQGERTDGDIWVNLVGGGLPTDPANTQAYDPGQVIGYYYDADGVARSLTTNTSLNLTAITSNLPEAAPTLYLYGWTSGRLYISYGSGFTGLSPSYTPTGGPYNGWQPAPASDGLDPNFLIRHQSMELSVIPQHNNERTAFSDVNEIWSNTTYIDYTAISLAMQAHNSSATHPTQWSKSTQEMLQAVAIRDPIDPEHPYTPTSNVLTVGYYKQEGDDYPTSPTPQEGYHPIVQIPGEQNPPPAQGAPYRNPVAFLPADGALPSPNFLRATGPGLIGTLGSAEGPTAVYHDWTNYLHALQPGGALNPAQAPLTTTIAGTFGGNQAYNLATTFHSGTIKIANEITYEGYVEMTGTIGGESVTIIIPYSELQKSEGIYGANPHYSVNNQPLQSPQNDVYTWVVGDLVAGMNLGLVGSPVQVTLEGVTQSIGAFTSTQWWQIANLNGGEYQFDGAQPNHNDFYNPYSAALREVTSGYNFAYTDRLGDSLTSFILNPSGSGQYTDAWLEILIQSDFSDPAGFPGIVPEPSPLALLSAAAALGFLHRLRRRRES